MSSVLRSSKFFKSILNLSKNIFLRDQAIYNHNLNRYNPCLIDTIYRNYIARPEINPNGTIEQGFKRLDWEVQRTGRIPMKELQEVFDIMKQSSTASVNQTLLIIRCCGNLVAEEAPEVRTKLVNEIWATLEKSNISMDISHYNTLLLVYLENEYQFSPTDFLKQLENKGIEPNRVTFQRLIAAYCQKGDIEGATQILEFMKEKEMPINEYVFNWLITGHFNTGDTESAEGILKVMEQAKMEPTSETYSALLNGYAKNGNINKINEIFLEYLQKGIDLTDKHLLGVVYTLAISNNYEFIDEVLNRTTKQAGYNRESKNTILRLLTRGEDDVALKLYKTMSPPKDALPKAYFLLQYMVKANRPFSKIISVCEELEKSGINTRALRAATEASLLDGSVELNLKLLSELAKKEEACQHYYWPALIRYGKSNNRQGVKNVMKQIQNDLNQPATSETLRDYIIPYLKENDNQIIDELRKSGISTNSVAAALTAHLLQNNNLKSAANIVNQYRANYNYGIIRKSLVTSYIQRPDTASLVTIVRAMQENSNEDPDDNRKPADSILLGIVNLIPKEYRKHIKEILEEYLKYNIGITTNTAEYLHNKLSGEDLTQEVSTLLTELTKPDLTLTELDRPVSQVNFTHKNAKKNGEYYEAMINKAEDEETKNKFKCLLLTHYCHNKYFEKAVALQEELESKNITFSPGIIILLMDLYCFHEKLDKALEYYSKVISLNDLTPDDVKLLRLANLLINNNRDEEALKILQNHQSKFVDKNFTINSVCWKLLNSVAEKGDVDMVNKLFETMKENKYIKPNNVILGSLIKSYLVKGDLNGALKKFEECCELYNATPWRSELSKKLIEAEDAASLQRLTDACTKIHGEINSLYDLVISFIECGMLRQAKKILETPGLAAKSNKLDKACLKYTNDGQVNNIEALIEISKNVPALDRSNMYYHLLNSYCNLDDVDKAQALWTKMQEEDVQPSDLFLITLAELLKKHDKPVPFTVPEISSEILGSKKNENAELSNTTRSLLKEFRTAMVQKNFDVALKLKNSYNLGASELNFMDKSKLLSLAVESGRLADASKLVLEWINPDKSIPLSYKSLIFCVNNLSKAGDIATMEKIKKILNEEALIKTSFSNKYTYALVLAGKSNELIEKFEKNIDQVESEEDAKRFSFEFPKGGIHAILNDLDGDMSRFEALAKKCEAKEIFDVTNALWSYYVSNDEVEKAEKKWNILKKAVKEKNYKLMYMKILNSANQEKRMDICEKFLKKCQEIKLPPSNLGPVATTMISILLSQGKTNEAELKLEECLQKVCSLEHIGITTLISLKGFVESEGRVFKYNIQNLRKPNRRENMNESSSSSSSSSDSDEEEIKSKLTEKVGS